MRRRRIFIAVGLLISVTFLVLVILALIGPTPSLISANYSPGSPEYCDYEVTDQIQIRLTFTPYASSLAATWGVDPNNWRNEPASMDFVRARLIVVPYLEYEITRDSGNTWEKFWTYENWESWYPSCTQFDKLDTETFWVWTLCGFAVTHDGGLSWITHDFCPVQQTWSPIEFWINALTFQSTERGIISQIDGKPDLVTTDGGRTWQPDPSSATPTADLN